MTDDRRRLDAHRSLTVAEQRLEGMMPDKWDSADGQSGQRATDAEIAKYRENIAANCIHEYSDDEMERILNRLAQAESQLAALQARLAVRQSDRDVAWQCIEVADKSGCWYVGERKDAVAKIIAAHVARETEPWRKRAEEAEVSLKKIANHPHCDYYHESNGATPYGTGCADGHRCAAQIANAYFATHPATGGGEE